MLGIGDKRERRKEARFQPILGEMSKQMKARFSVLSKKYTWEIIADLMEGKKNLTQIRVEGNPLHDPSEQGSIDGEVEIYHHTY